MMTHGKEPSRNLRGKTDKSLEKERHTTDAHLDRKKANVERATTKSIHAGRVSADAIRDVKRAQSDAARSSRRRAHPERKTAELDDQLLARERSTADAVQLEERQKEDKLREKERFQKRLIAEAMLDLERKETDTHLSAERSSLDMDSIVSTASLDKTKSDLVTRDHFVAVVSHDLRSPLNAVSLSSGILRKGLTSGMAKPADLLRCVDMIERNVAQMDRLISDLLDVERMANGKLSLKPAKVDICSLLRNCKELFAPVVASKKFTMTIETCPEPVFALVDQDRILQVLSNLIGNALKFTPQGGTIKLFTEKSRKHIRVFVADNGPGIPPNRQKEIFERFSQLRLTDRRGLGLGLFISKWIVEAHGGRILVSSKKGQGCTFSFTLPLAAN